MIAALIVAAAWGLAEAVVFVIVADVPISLIAARRGWRAGAWAAAIAAIGASAGGGIVWALTRSDTAGIAALYAALPAISPAMVAQAIDAFAQEGWRAALAGAFSGIPYKLYAYAAAIDGASLPMLLAMTPLIRLPRFLLIAAGSALLRGTLAPRLGQHGLALLLAGWALFYAWYFHHMPS